MRPCLARQHFFKRPAVNPVLFTQGFVAQVVADVGQQFVTLALGAANVDNVKVGQLRLRQVHAALGKLSAPLKVFSSQHDTPRDLMCTSPSLR